MGFVINLKTFKYPILQEKKKMRCRERNPLCTHFFHKDNLAVKTNITMTKVTVFHPYQILSTTTGFLLPMPFSDSNQEKQLYFPRIHEGNEP